MSAADVGIVVLVALAAAVGATIRFVVGDQLNRGFPTGTLAVNLVASAALGLLASGPEALRVVVGVGALGALSTWSTAANEAATMSREGNGALGLGYLALTVSSGILTAWFGLRLGTARLRLSSTTPRFGGSGRIGLLDPPNVGGTGVSR